MIRFRLNLHRLFRRPTVTGPYRIYVRCTPAGAFLDVEHFLVAAIKTIADNPDLMDLLAEIAVDREQSRGHDGWEPEELLVERLTTALGYELPVHGAELNRLALRLSAVNWAVNGQSFPVQQPEGSAA